MLTGLAPVWRADARLLILGSFPGAASLRAQRYYAHPRNAFWPLMGDLLGRADLARLDYPVRLQTLVDHQVALWDAVASCDRPGSLDADIRAAQRSDLKSLVAALPQLKVIACNGAEAHRQAVKELPHWNLLRLPSTSPAHAGMPMAAKREAWRQALAVCDWTMTDPHETDSALRSMPTILGP